MSKEISFTEIRDGEMRVDELRGKVLTDKDKLERNGKAPGSAVSEEMIRNDATSPESWLQYNKGLNQNGYSPADRLTAADLSGLEPAYSIKTDDSGLETNPVIVPGDPPVMYFTQNNQVVRAANARTGELYWTYRYSLPEDADFDPIPRDRGPAVYGDTVYFGTGVMSLLALNRYTGEKRWEVDGITDAQKEEIPYAWVGYGFASAPAVYDGKVYVGQCGGDSSPPGYTFAMAFDAESGDKVWQQRMGPKDQWVGETWKHANASPWQAPAIDPETDTVFWNSGNPGPMLNGLVRPGPNQMSAGIVAFDAQSGDVKWNFQMAPGDIWDYDLNTTPMLFDMKVDGERKRVVKSDHKSGWSFVFDAETGKILERGTFAKQDGVFYKLIPRGKENAKICWPGSMGGTQWPSDSYSPDTGLGYIGANDYAMTLAYTPGWEFEKDAGIGGTLGTPDNLEELNQKIAVRAIKPSEGTLAWEHEFQDVDTAQDQSLIFAGGTTVTAGNLVFAGSPGGHLVALDATDGTLLGRADTGGRITASPVVWDDPKQGRQYVAAAADDRVVVYSTEA